VPGFAHCGEFGPPGKPVVCCEEESKEVSEEESKDKKQSKDKEESIESIERNAP